MRKAFNVMDCIGQFNAVRSTFGCAPFTEGVLKNKLKEIGCLKDHMFFNGMVKAGILRKITKDIYVFTSDKPVHYSKLQTAYNYVVELRQGKAKSSALNQILGDATALSAISLLKGLGCDITLRENKKIKF